MTNLLGATNNINKVTDTIIKNENVQATVNKSKEVVSDSFQNSSAVKTMSGAGDTNNLKYLPAVYLADLMIEKGFQKGGNKDSLSRWAKIGDKISDMFHLDAFFEKAGKQLNKVKSNRFFKYFSNDYKAIPKSSMAKPRALADELLGSLADETTGIFEKLKQNKEFGNKLKSGAVTLSDDAMAALKKAGTLTEPMSDDLVRDVFKALKELSTKLPDEDERKALKSISGELVKYLNNGRKLHGGSKTVVSMLSDTDVANTIATTLSMLKDKPEIASLSPQAKKVFTSIVQNADDVAAKIPKEKVAGIVEELISKGILDDAALEDTAKGILGSLTTSTKQKVIGLRNKANAASMSKGKSILGKHLSKGALRAKDTMTMGGGILGALFTSMAIAQTLKETKDAPEGEKLSTFMHVLSEQYLGMILYQPSINLMYKLGGNKYRGMTPEAKKTLNNLVTKTNIKVDASDVAKLQQKLIRKGIEPEAVAKLSGKSIKEAKQIAKGLTGGGILGKVLGFIKSPIGSISKLFAGKPELSQKSLDAIEEIAKKAKLDRPEIAQSVKIAKLQKSLLLKGVDKEKVASLSGKTVKEARKLAKSLGKEGAKLKFWEKPLKAIANLLTTGLDTIKGTGAGKAGSKLKGFVGGFGRFALIMFVLQPLIQKPITKLINKIFGKPTTYLAKQKAAEGTPNNEGTEVAATNSETTVPNTTNLLDIWSAKQNPAPQVPQPEIATTEIKTDSATPNIQINNTFAPNQQPKQDEVAALNLFNKDKKEERYIPSINVTFEEQPSAAEARAEALLKSTESLIKNTKKYL